VEASFELKAPGGGGRKKYKSSISIQRQECNPLINYLIFFLEIPPLQPRGSWPDH
jgi:hypothetical protein